uniref:NADAR domain-containing protein n=1 Tax=Ditylenchus dipsaci TaxID=166011 RepID=A0A915DGF4_9BILA
MNAVERQNEYPQQNCKSSNGDDALVFRSKHSIFSNFFTKEQGLFEIDGVSYVSSEQFYAAKKAEWDGKEQLAQEIMDEVDPVSIKRLSAKVENKWGSKKTEWRQVPQTKLLLSSDLVLVEGNGNDYYWGCGVDRDDARISQQDEWTGENRMGRLLMSLRRRFMREMQEVDEPVQEPSPSKLENRHQEPKLSENEVVAPSFSRSLFSNFGQVAAVSSKAHAQKWLEAASVDLSKKSTIKNTLETDHQRLSQSERDLQLNDRKPEDDVVDDGSERNHTSTPITSPIPSCTRSSRSVSQAANIAGRRIEALTEEDLGKMGELVNAVVKYKYPRSIFFDDLMLFMNEIEPRFSSLEQTTHWTYNEFFERCCRGIKVFGKQEWKICCGMSNE